MAVDQPNSKDDATGESLAVAEQARAVAPVVWLIGKVQAGKSSIVGALTGKPSAEIGTGYKACTKTAKIFDFPEDVPLIRFLDTRGLGEANYDAREDIEVARGASQCTIAVMRAMDTHQDSVLRVLTEIRQADGGWPIVIAQTHLHEGYPPGGEHALPYPFAWGSHGNAGEAGVVARAGEADDVPPPLLAALEAQRETFSKLPGNGPIAFVAIDFTKPEDDYSPPEYGRDALIEALAGVGSSALAAALADVDFGADSRGDSTAGDNHRLIVGYASAAAAADLIPLAAVAAVPAVQAKLMHTLSQKLGISWSRRMSFEFAGALGAGALTRYAAGFGIRQLVKLIPAYGQTVGATAAAAASFATTFALGKAADYYLKRMQTGRQASSEEIKDVWAKSLREAFDLAKQRGFNDRGEVAP